MKYLVIVMIVILIFKDDLLNYIGRGVYTGVQEEAKADIKSDIGELVEYTVDKAWEETKNTLKGMINNAF